MTTSSGFRYSKRLAEQIDFIRASCQRFDEGSESEALRIAVSLRVLFHHTPASTSLISHLGFGSKQMLSSGLGQGNHLDYLSFEINLNRAEPIRTKPRMENRFRAVTIPEWWEGEEIFTYEEIKYFRRNIICDVANKDGGAHVDATLPDYFQGLYAGGPTLGITGDLTYSGGPPPFEQGVLQHPANGHLSLIRQFGYEFLASVSHFAWQS